jgi:DNA polymerase-3 subunit epsilon
VPSLPARYYLQHFRELLDFVHREYAHVLGQRERALGRAFDRLDPDDQCLYVRLANRKAHVFAACRLAYPELGALGPGLRRLRRAGWLADPGMGDLEHLLRAVSRQSLYEALRATLAGTGSRLKKSELMALARAHPRPGQLLAHPALGGLVALRRARWVEFLVFLYFGSVDEGMSRFTLRDLGLARTRMARDGFEPRFDDPDEARNAFFFARRLRWARQGLPVSTANWPDPLSDTARRLSDRLAATLGRQAESAGEAESALAIYHLGNSGECLERRVRLLLSSGRRSAARRSLEAWLADPGSEEDRIVASDLMARVFTGKRTSRATDLLRDAACIELDEAWVGAAERGAIEFYRRRGFEAYRAENRLWRMLFGLTFWDLLFGRQADRRRSPFDRLPPDLKEGGFYARRGRDIEARLALFARPGAAMAALLKASAARYGTPNDLVRWSPGMLEPARCLLNHSDGSGVAAMLRDMARDYSGTRHGFPDLVVAGGGIARLVEIKADGDTLRRNQVARLEQLRQAGLDVDVVRVRWKPDPRQSYVVVDVETTGGLGGAHRVTEIGAVLVRDGQVLARFDTLLNPGRRIPARITRLTGITEAMVASAPVFADIAGAFLEFAGDAVFVAHNVRFDYRFIQQEYARLGRVFRRPRVCTCAGMRKAFPGRRSYALDALCREFGIPLERHHRALCDAEAAAALLALVHERQAACG